MPLVPAKSTSIPSAPTVIAATKSTGASSPSIRIALRVGAGLEPADCSQRRRLRPLDDVAPERAEIVDPELVHHLEQAAAAHVVAGGERVEVAHHLHRLAHVRRHDVDQRAVDRFRRSAKRMIGM